MMERVQATSKHLAEQLAVAIDAILQIHQDAIALNSALRECISARGRYPSTHMFELVVRLDHFLKRFGGFEAFGDIEELRPVSPFA